MKQGKRVQILTPLQVSETKYAEQRSSSGALTGNRLADGAGLYLFITPNGAKSWRFDFRYLGKRRVLVYGSFPDLGLAAARQEHAKARLLLAQGLDPADEKKKGRQAQRLAIEQERAESKNTFRNVAEDWMQATVKAKGKAGKKPSKTWASNIERWIGWANDEFGNRRLPEIEAPDVLRLINRIAEKAPASAEFCRQTISRVFSYGIRNLMAPKGFNPGEAVRGAIIVPEKKHHPKLVAKEIPAFLAALDKYQGPEAVKIGMHLLLHCWTRKNELAGARWSEIDFNAATWTVPAERMKMKREHVIPLTPQVVAMFRRLKELAEDSPFVFPSRQRNKPDQPMGGETFNYTMKVIGYKGRFGPHGVRATAASILADAGWDADIIEIQLAHARQGTKAAYLRNTYLPQRRDMLMAWSGILDSYKAGGAIIVPIGAGKAA